VSGGELPRSPDGELKPSISSVNSIGLPSLSGVGGRLYKPTLCQPFPEWEPTGPRNAQRSALVTRLTAKVRPKSGKEFTRNSHPKPEPRACGPAARRMTSPSTAIPRIDQHRRNPTRGAAFRR